MEVYFLNLLVLKSTLQNNAIQDIFNSKSDGPRESKYATFVNSQKLKKKKGGHNKMIFILKSQYWSLKVGLK